jgi:hypothetical protein
LKFFFVVFMGCNSSREGGDVELGQASEAQLADLRQQLQQREQEMQQLQQQIQQRQQQEQQLQQQVEQQQQQLAQQQQQLQQQQQQQSEPEKKKKEKRTKSVALKTVSEDEAKKTAALQQQLKDLEVAKSKEVAELKSQIAQLEQRIKELQDQPQQQSLGASNKKVAAPKAISAPEVSESDLVEKLRKELDAEKKLTADLRADAMRKTKEALASASGDGAGGAKNSSLVVVEATEKQRMNEALLRSELKQLQESLATERALKEAAKAESEVRRKKKKGKKGR